MIINRIGTYPYVHGGHPKNVTEVIKITGFDAWKDKTPTFQKAMDFMDAHKGWVKNPEDHRFREYILSEPAHLRALTKAITPIYQHHKVTTIATYYFSPRTQDWLHKNHHVKKSATEKHYEWTHDLKLKKVEITLAPTDDFEFYK